MPLLDRVNTALAHSRAARPQNLSVDEYASWFTYGGLGYPFLQTTYSQLDQERIARNTTLAAKQHGPTFALIYARMQVFSQIRFQWTRMQGAQPGDLFGSNELRVLERPWPGGTTSDLLARMEWDASTSGISYWRRKGDSMHRLYPSWVIVVLGSDEDAEAPQYASDTTLLGYLWVPPGGKMQFFDPTQVTHYAPIPDLDTHYLGQSWINPVLRDLQSDQAAVEHKFKFFENGATSNLAIGFDPQVSVEQVRQFKDLFEQEHKGVAKAFKTMFLGGGAKPVPVGSSFKDMDYAIVQGKAESRLASAAGVPPSWVGFSEGLEGSALNAGNFTSARRRFSDGTMAHLWANAAASLEPIIGQPRNRAGKPIMGASLWYDSRIPFMRADESDLAAVQRSEAATIVALSNGGFTRDSVVNAVRNNDWTLLKADPNWVSVQLQPGNDSAAVPGLPPETTNALARLQEIDELEIARRAAMNGAGA